MTIHHELGHGYYDMQYDKLPFLYRQGANDGFHEGIGDTLALSVTPQYLKKLGLLDQAPDNEHARLNQMMKRALEKVAFLPFGLLIDKWRWDVFAGKTTPDRYNAAWWELRMRYQGVVAPVTRNEQDFDPGAKFHVPANTPYMRYFLAHICSFNSTARSARPRATMARSILARSMEQARWRAAARDAGNGRQQAVARGAVGPERRDADRRLGSARLLRPAHHLARTAEQGADLRVVIPTGSFAEPPSRFATKASDGEAHGEVLSLWRQSEGGSLPRERSIERAYEHPKGRRRASARGFDTCHRRLDAGRPRIGERMRQGRLGHRAGPP